MSSPALYLIILLLSVYIARTIAGQNVIVSINHNLLESIVLFGVVNYHFLDRVKGSALSS